jgi:hypothetical protein
MGLIGCIYIPATYQFQTNGNLRPESIVGHGKAIEPGRTTLVDALIAFNRQAKGHPRRAHSIMFSAAFRPAISPVFAKDRRSVASSYEIHTGSWIYPLCFTATDDGRMRWIVLDLDQNDIVQGSHTYAELPTDRFDEPRYGSAVFAFRQALSAEQKIQLAEARVIPSDAQIEAAAARQRDVAARIAAAQAQRAAATRTTTSPSTIP